MGYGKQRRSDTVIDIDIFVNDWSISLSFILWSSHNLFKKKTSSVATSISSIHTLTRRHISSYRHTDRQTARIVPSQHVRCDCSECINIPMLASMMNSFFTSIIPSTVHRPSLAAQTSGTIYRNSIASNHAKFVDFLCGVLCGVCDAIAIGWYECENSTSTKASRWIIFCQWFCVRKGEKMLNFVEKERTALLGVLKAGWSCGIKFGGMQRWSYDHFSIASMSATNFLVFKWIFVVSPVSPMKITQISAGTRTQRLPTQWAHTCQKTRVNASTVTRTSVSNTPRK